MAWESGRDSRLAKIIFPALLLTTVLARLPTSVARGRRKGWRWGWRVPQGPGYFRDNSEGRQIPATLPASSEIALHPDGRGRIPFSLSPGGG